MNEALLPCPFCGAECHFEIDDEQWQWVECGRCKMQSNRSVSLMEDCKPTLTAAWNCRAALASAPAETMTLQEVWNAAGGNPGIKPTRDDVLLALKTLDEVCDEVDRAKAPAATPQADSQPAPVQVEMHEAKCPALIGDKCACARADSVVDAAWAQFCAGIGDGPNAPYPGMIGAFERYYSQSFADRDWRKETSVWAAAWKACCAARAQADSVLEDAARYRWLTADHHKQEDRIRVYDIATSMNVRRKRSIDAAIDAARKQGEKP